LNSTEANLPTSRLMDWKKENLNW